MKTKIALAVLLSFITCAFAAQKSVKKPSPSTGILVASIFGFYLQGDGISTTLTITPARIPQVFANGLATLPKLQLVGVSDIAPICQNGVTFTATVSGNQLVMNFPTPPPVGITACTVSLLFQPE